MTYFVNSLLLGLMLLISGCYSEGIKFDPKFHIHNSQIAGIVSENGHYISCNDQEFEDFASMPKEKIKELAEILKRARLPRDLEKRKDFLINLLEDVYKSKSKVNPGDVFYQ